MTNGLAYILVFAGALALGSALAEDPSAHDLVGTWRLVEFTDVRDGKVVRAFGDEPLGIFIYAPSGYVSIHLLHNPLPKGFDDLDLPTAKQDSLDTRSYAGYFGTYEVDVKRSMVIHHVEGGTLLGYIGTAQERPFRLDGNRLIIGDDETWRRVLERVPDKQTQEVAAGGGEVRAFEPGDVVLLEDPTGWGHLSKITSLEGSVVMMVPLPAE